MNQLIAHSDMDRAVPYGSTHSIGEHPLLALGARMTLWAAVCIWTLMDAHLPNRGTRTKRVPGSRRQLHRAGAPGLADTTAGRQPGYLGGQREISGERHRGRHAQAGRGHPVCGERTLRVSGPARAAVPERPYQAAGIGFHRPHASRWCCATLILLSNIRQRP